MRPARRDRRVRDLEEEEETSSGSGSSSDDESQRTDKKQEEPIQIGMTAETKDLYREDYCYPWEEWAPDDIGINSKSTRESSKFALIVRREKENGDTEEPVLVLHSITVQSPLLKEALGPVFADYSGINTNLKKLEFRAPFREFFYRWTEFVEASPSQDNDEETASKHYKLLFDVISDEIQPHIDQAEDLLQNDVISFDYVWTLFEPGTEIHSIVDGQDRLYLLNSGGYQGLPNGVKVYNLSCRYVDTDGESFGYSTTNLTISEFANLKPVSELNVLPSHLKSGILDIRARLEMRGVKFETLIGMHYMAYSGAYDLRKVPVGASRRQFIEDGRVMVDCASFMRYNGERSGFLAPLDGGNSSSHSDIPHMIPTFGESDSEDDAPPAVQYMQHMARQARRKYASGRQGTQAGALSPEHYVLCSPLVQGFCLKTKQWAFFYVDLVEDIIWNKHAFEQLVLPHDYKQIVWAFVDAQLSQSDDFDDLIKGKGKGIILLLSGEPGTGKTLTSESVSEAMKKPLYSMSAGELGDDADTVEQNLSRVLELSTKWDAVLLIDECDVFLEQRTTSDLHRNKLVSVFLRLLEYYQGVMFLTTNRVATFDPAFESRIHLTINYPKLDLKSRLHIWRTFVNPGSTGSAVQEMELDELAEAELNGRQIKNVVKTARLLAARDKVPLAMEHIAMVLRVKAGAPAGLKD